MNDDEELCVVCDLPVTCHWIETKLEYPDGAIVVGIAHIDCIEKFVIPSPNGQGT